MHCSGTKNARACTPDAHENGYILAVVMLLVALMLAFLAAAVPKVREEIQRDQEVETMHRGQQYIRAIQLYYRRFHTYPSSVDALLNTNEIRFLRKRYTDPITGKDDWKPIFFGQNKAPTAMGFFGQPLGMIGTTAAGIGAPAESNNGTGDNSNNDSGTDSGQTYGGPIIGFSPASDKPSIMVYKTKDHYNEWEFVYDPANDGMMRGMMPMQPPPQPPTNSGSPGFNPGAAGAGQGGGTPPSDNP
jgi:type II secretory pathway pseudopilin PulG